MKVSQTTQRPARTRVLMVTTVLVCVFGFVKIFYYPRLQALNTLTETSKTLIQENETKSNKVTQLASVQTDAHTKQSISNIDKQLSSNDRLAKLLSTLSAEGFAFTVKRLTTATHEQMASYTKIHFILEIDTSFLTLGKFIDHLEHSDRLLQIKSIEVTRIEKELKKCSAKISFYAYVGRAAL